jgi:type I restriction enzyme, S subunit
MSKIEMNDIKFKKVTWLFKKEIQLPENWKWEKIMDNSILKGRIGWQGLTTKEYLQKGKFHLVTGTDFKNGRINWENCVYVDEERYSQDLNIQLKKRDVLVTKDGTIGKIAYVHAVATPATLNTGVFVIRPINKKYFPLFFYYVLNSKFFHKFLNRLKAGSTINHLYQKDFVNFYFPIPSYNEQQKIVFILSSVDDLINKYDSLIESTKKLKKSLMHKLLTRGIGHKKFKKLMVIPRFINFSIPDSWNMMKLHEISTEIKDGPMGFGLHTYDYVEVGIPVLRIQNLKNLTVTKDRLRYISKEKHNELKKSQVKPLDIIISKTGVLGMIGIVPKDYGQANLNQALARITLKDKKIIPYVAAFLSSKIPQQILNVVGSGRTVQSGLKLSDIKNLEIPIPPLEEQQKIMSALSRTDSYFENLKSTKTELQILKQGLMQKLLTGEIRVTV